MSDTAILGRMLRQEARVPLQGHTVKLEERHANGAHSVEIDGVPADAVVLRVDANFSNDGLFTGSQGECRRADYLIVSRKKNAAIAVELKSGIHNDADLANQLQGCMCVFEYCKLVAQAFYDPRSFQQTYKQRYVVFAREPARQEPVRRAKRNANNASPLQPLKLSSGSIHFNAMIAG